FASIVAGRRSKWVVLLVWLIAVFAVFPLGSNLSDQTTDSTESFLPASAESTEVVRKLEHDFPQGQTDTGIVVYQNTHGLTPAARQKILADAKPIQAVGNDKIHLVEPPVTPFTSGQTQALISKDGTVATMVL